MSWPRFLGAFFATLLVVAAAAWAALAIVDPYGTGRFTPIASQFVFDEAPRLTDANRARDPSFDSAVIGNSTIQSLDPRRLDTSTGRHFVQLSIPGTWAPEQIAVLDSFRRHHKKRARIVVIGIDATWCQPGLKPTRETALNPFPFWLYSSSDVEYVGSLMSTLSWKVAAARLRVWLRRLPAARADGYDDYENGRVYDPSTAQARIKKEGIQGLDAPAAGALDFPAFHELAAALQKLDPSSQKIIVFPPIAAVKMTAARIEAASDCHTAARKALQAVPNITVLDFFTKNVITQDERNFWDPIHYRSSIARRIEDAISEVLKGAPPDRAVGQALSFAAECPGFMEALRLDDVV